MTLRCFSCEANRQLKTRIKEHMNNVRLEPSKHSVITEHILKFNHFFYWEKVKNLDLKPNYNKRLISEIYIKKQKHDINSQKDTFLTIPIFVY